MFIVYYDESGDDGFPKYSSILFSLSAVYMHFQDWKDNFEKIRNLRKSLSAKYGLPVKIELHTRELLLNKNPYRQFNFTDTQRIEIIDEFCDLLAQLKLQIVNVVINKNNIQKGKYNVLDTALTYSVQRIENDLKKNDPNHKFLIITDEGRVGKMRDTTRKIQRILYTPSKINPGTSYRTEIKCLIEDPLPKNSRESYFIQMADMTALLCYLRKLSDLKLGSFPSRFPKGVDDKKVEDWLNRIKPVLNLAASKNKFGIVCYPK